MRHDYHSVRCYKPSLYPPCFDTPATKKSGGGRLPKKDAEPPSWLAEAKEAYLSGATIADLEIRFDKGHPTLTRWLRWAGVEMRPPHRKHALSPEQEREVLRLHRDENVPKTTLAKKYGVGPCVIYRILGEEAAKDAADMVGNGARDRDQPPDPAPVVVPTVPTTPTRRRPVRPPKEIPAAPDWVGLAARLYGEGKSMAEVADEVGVNTSRVLKWLNWTGVSIRKGTRSRRFSDEEEREIYRQHTEGWMSRRALARKYQVAIDTIGRVILRQIAKMAAEAKGPYPFTGRG
jgi:transposase-like protein